MELEEFKALIQGKTFKSTDGGFEYNFVPENTLKVFNDLSRSTHYTIEQGERVNTFILNHNSLFGTEPYLLELVKENPIALTVSKQFSQEFEGTWIEVQKDLL